MPETEVIVVEDDGHELIRHQLGKILFATAAAFAASKLAEKAYDQILAYYRAKQI